MRRTRRLQGLRAVESMGRVISVEADGEHTQMLQSEKLRWSPTCSRRGLRKLILDQSENSGCSWLTYVPLSPRSSIFSSTSSPARDVRSNEGHGTYRIQG